MGWRPCRPSGKNGRITAAGGPYAGLEVEEAAERVTADLRTLGALVKVEDYPHSVATCDRCGTPIEPLISEQWFMEMDELKKPATDVVREGKVRFTPERWGRVYVDWMDNLRAVVYQPAALVGPPVAGVVLPGWAYHRRGDGAVRLCRVQLGRPHSRDRRPRHLVQLGPLAVRHVRLAGPTPRTSRASTRPTC